MRGYATFLLSYLSARQTPISRISCRSTLVNALLRKRTNERKLIRRTTAPRRGPAPPPNLCIKISAYDYSISFIDRAAGVPAHWIASQSLELRGKDDVAVLVLVGQLQELGLTIGSLGWQVPQEGLDAAGRHARLAALASLREEAGEAASALGLVVDRYQAIDLSGGPRPVFDGPRPMMAAVAMASPMATPDAQQVTATVTADVVLTRPRGLPASNH